MNGTLHVVVAEIFRLGGGPVWGKAAFVGVFVALLLWLLFLPAGLVDSDGARRSWWRNARFWAIFVTVVQIGVYMLWG